MVRAPCAGELGPADEGAFESERAGAMVGRTPRARAIAPRELFNHRAAGIAQRQHVASVGKIQAAAEGGPLHARAAEAAGGHAAAEHHQRPARRQRGAERKDVPLRLARIAERPARKAHGCSAGVHELDELIVRRVAHAVGVGIARASFRRIGQDFVDHEVRAGARCRRRLAGGLGVLEQEEPRRADHLGHFMRRARHDREAPFQGRVDRRRSAPCSREIMLAAREARRSLRHGLARSAQQPIRIGRRGIACTQQHRERRREEPAHVGALEGAAAQAVGHLEVRRVTGDRQGVPARVGGDRAEHARLRQESDQAVDELRAGAVAEEVVALLAATEQAPHGFEHPLDFRVPAGVQRVVLLHAVGVPRKLDRDRERIVPFGDRCGRLQIAFGAASRAMHDEPDGTAQRIECGGSVDESGEAVAVARLEAHRAETHGLDGGGIEPLRRVPRFRCCRSRHRSRAWPSTGTSPSGRQRRSRFM